MSLDRRLNWLILRVQLSPITLVSSSSSSATSNFDCFSMEEHLILSARDSLLWEVNWQPNSLLTRDLSHLAAPNFPVNAHQTGKIALECNDKQPEKLFTSIQSIAKIWQQNEMFPFNSSKHLSKITCLLITISLIYCITKNVSFVLCAARNLYTSNQFHNHNIDSQPTAADLRQQHVARSLVINSPPTTQPPPIEIPDFEEPIGNHTVALGKNAELSCKINNLGNFRTAWLRVEDKGILTIHNNTITRNYRISLINNDPEKNRFVLAIKNVQPSDKVSYRASQMFLSI